MSSTKPAGRTDATDTTTDVEGYGSQESLDQGYFGTVPDPTPNENYTFAGQIAGKPTPETVPPRGQGDQANPLEPAGRKTGS